ncbi:MAG TPA: PLP-dependent aminotransferase family protein, partial [Polyangiales bacterium]|nr:PLP-dependent aminotransferase family protein [Polyangiales bacterium]
QICTGTGRPNLYWSVDPVARRLGSTMNIDSLLYEQVASHVESLIAAGTLRSGDRLPSVRRFAREREVSIATVLAAYRSLEERALIETRPKSGHFVCHAAIRPVAVRPQRAAALAPTRVTVSDVVSSLVRTMADPRVVPLGAAQLAPELYPIRTLNRLLSGILREMSTAGASYEPPPGLLTLRRELAKRSLIWGMSASEDDFLITSGAMEALHLALRATTRPGDSIAVSTPIYFGILQLLEELGLRVVEIPSHPEHGMDLSALEQALKKLDIKACIAIPTFDNPNGSLMPTAARVQLAALIERYDVPLIEDDIYGDLAWDHSRPSPVKAHDRSGRILHVGSFSKTLAAGYRVGWIMPGRYAERVARLKFSHSVSTSTLEQMAVAEYLSLGGYDRHLRKLRTRLNQQVRAFREAIAASFPAGTTVSDPRGGYLLWVTLPREVDAMQLQAAAAKRGIMFAPGPVFAAGQRYKHHLRLNCGFPWSEKIAGALRTLGELATQQLSDNRRAG